MGKVVAQARAEGSTLSDAERRMLWWSESDPAFVERPGLLEQLASETSDEDYEDKIAGLLARAQTDAGQVLPHDAIGTSLEDCP